VDRVVLPERRVLHAVALQQHVGAADQLNHRRAQVVADAEDALGRHAGFGQRRQVLRIGAPFIAFALNQQALCFRQRGATSPATARSAD
jgi:hypothetical protein